MRKTRRAKWPPPAPSVSDATSGVIGPVASNLDGRPAASPDGAKSHARKSRRGCKGGAS